MDHNLTHFLTWLEEHNRHGRMRVTQEDDLVRFSCGGKKCAGTMYYIRTAYYDD